MFIESLNALLKSGKPSGIKKGRERNFTKSLPFKYQFRMSGLYISTIPRLMAGIFVGILSAITGIGDGFIMAPAMFDILGMPTKVVVGVSLVKIIFVAAFTTLLNAITNYTVDMVLAVLILVGGFIGVQVGIQPRTRLKAKKLRILSAFMVLAISGKLAIDLLLQPAELYSISAAEGY